MVRSLGKYPHNKFVVLGSCVGLITAAILTNFLWASTYRSLFVSSAYPRSLTPNMKGERQELRLGVDDEDDAHILEWEEVAEAPVGRLDGAAVQIGNHLYVFAGYATIDKVHSHVDIYNLRSNSWEGSIEMPQEMAHSHLGMATDGQYIYAVTGQHGPQCRGPTSLNFVLDIQTKQWSHLPPLPLPRYAPATQLWKGRLHVMGGSKENRYDPALEHWSIAVDNGKAVESEWRSEIPIPRGGPHRACVVVDNRLYVIGGQEGDFIAKPGSPIFKCSRKLEVVFSDVYMLEPGGKEWNVVPSMPKPDSHIEFAWVVVNKSIIIVGGSTEKNPVTKKMVLIGDVFQFNTQRMVWKTIGQMPYRVKTTLAAYWDGWLYFTAGQRDKGIDDPSPKKIMGKTWRTRLNLSP